MPRPHRKEYRQYRLAYLVYPLAHRLRDVRNNTARDCYLAKIVLFVRIACYTTVGQHELYSFSQHLRTPNNPFVQVNNQIVEIVLPLVTEANTT